MSPHIPLDSNDPELYHVYTHAPGPAGRLPLDDANLRTAPSGDVFGLTMDAIIEQLSCSRRS